MRTAEEIIEDVKCNRDLKGYSLLEIYLYLCIEQILKMYANNQISKEDANRRKQIATKKYEDCLKQYEFESEMFKEKVEASNRTSYLRNELRKKWKEDTEITVERLAELLNIALEIISITYKEKF